MEEDYIWNSMIMAEKSTLDEESLQQIYTWIDEIPLSRPKKNITRDFSDGVLIAEIVHHFVPKMVDLHNYTAASSSTTKLDNWNLLSRKCFTKLNYNIDENLVKGAVSCKTGSIELVLQDLRQHIESYLACKRAASLVEKQKYHDELSSENYPYDPTIEQYHAQTLPNGYSGAVNGYGYNYASSGAEAVQGVMGVADQSFMPHPPYQYQSPPIVAAHNSNDHGTANDTEDRKQQGSADLQAKPRKPVTQATKIKSKPSPKTSQPTGPGGGNEVGMLRIALEEKEQALLASQETVQILQAKIRRLEHLLHLKDLRINEIKNHHMQQSPPPLNQASTMNQQPRHLPPTQNFPIHAQPPPHAFNNFPPHPPLPQIPRPNPDETRKKR